MAPPRPTSPPGAGRATRAASPAPMGWAARVAQAKAGRRQGVHHAVRLRPRRHDPRPRSPGPPMSSARWLWDTAGGHLAEEPANGGVGGTLDLPITVVAEAMVLAVHRTLGAEWGGLVAPAAARLRRPGHSHRRPGWGGRWPRCRPVLQPRQTPFSALCKSSWANKCPPGPGSRSGWPALPVPNPPAGGRALRCWR